MKVIIAVLCIFSFLTTSVFGAAGDTFIDYQNYNHGYCPECNNYPCQCDSGCCPNADPCTTCPNTATSAPPYPLEPQTCPAPNPCTPCEEGDVCGISVYWIAIIIVAIATAAAIIVGANNGRTP